jgi:hypothetical protein
MAKRKPKSTLADPISVHDRLKDAYALYHRTKATADAAPTKTNVENYLRAHTLVSRLERESSIDATQRPKIMVRKRG